MTDCEREKLMAELERMTTARALEIVLSRCKMDNGTAHVLKGLLGYARAALGQEGGE